MPTGSISNEKRKVCAIGVHNSFPVATILDQDEKRKTRKVSQETEPFLEFREWILPERCDSVAFGSTGDSWRTVFVVLRDRIPVTVRNARLIKHLPGRKTDINDSR
jgi:transposase